MPIFLKHVLLKNTLSLRTIVDLNIKGSSKYPKTLLEALPVLFVQCCLKALAPDVLYGSLWAALCACLELTGQKMKRAQIILVPTFIPSLYSPVILHYLPRDHSKIGYNCLLSPHFYLMPCNIQSNAQGGELHRQRLWLIGAGSDRRSVASRGRVLRSI